MPRAYGYGFAKDHPLCGLSILGYHQVPHKPGFFRTYVSAPAGWPSLDPLLNQLGIFPHLPVPGRNTAVRQLWKQLHRPDVIEELRHVEVLMDLVL